MAVLSFIVNDIFGQGAIFIALIAMIGLILQKKPFGERGCGGKVGPFPTLQVPGSDGTAPGSCSPDRS